MIYLVWGTSIIRFFSGFGASIFFYHVGKLNNKNAFHVAKRYVPTVAKF